MFLKFDAAIPCLEIYTKKGIWVDFKIMMSNMMDITAGYCKKDVAAINNNVAVAGVAQ